MDTNVERRDLTKRLPVEILVMIMWEFIYMEDVQELSNPNNTCKATLIASVCQRWRMITLGDHSRFLWSQINLGWPKDAVARSLERSVGATISLSIVDRALKSKNFSHFEAQLTSHIERVGRLIIIWESHSHYDIDHWLQKVMDGTCILPKLWQLHLSPRQWSLVSSGAILEGIKAPHLSHLSAYNFRSEFTLPSTCRLTYLNASWSSITSHEAIVILNSFPELENVILGETGSLLWGFDIERSEDSSTGSETSSNDIEPNPNESENSKQTQANSPPTYLHALKNLRIGPCFGPCADHILSSILCPPTSEVSIQIFRDEEESILVSLPNCLKSILSSSMTLYVHSAWFGKEYDQFGYIATVLEFSSHDAPRYRVEFEAGAYKDYLTETNVLAELVSLDWTHRLEKFELSFRLLPDAECLIALFNNFPNLKEMAISTFELDSFLTALGSQSSGSPLCPDLRELDLSRSNFLTGQLKDVLDFRKERLCRVEGLRMTVDSPFDVMSASFLSVDRLSQTLERRLNEWGPDEAKRALQHLVGDGVVDELDEQNTSDDDWIEAHHDSCMCYECTTNPLFFPSELREEAFGKDYDSNYEEIDFRWGRYWTQKSGMYKPSW
ncbi:hypothetical protein SISSUDRAFT_221684 [Sistotremastrum suecicum HHB10207 ss-3]|uniref:F-box domain-containing protein n=1 Tax=Sistotremastrum suecicum HHB10207 ss-3 TaxID=1314776 RepID=A0A166A422_9AGAM|nr:hypothetical protein SISSUDRAFT_221684 [Sistotremastrum suecicum HHB10207 ss-3]